MWVSQPIPARWENYVGDAFVTAYGGAKDMTKKFCLETVKQFIARGERDQAVAHCQETECMDFLECQKYLGWAHYQDGSLNEARACFERVLMAVDGDATYGAATICFAQRDYQKAFQYFEQAAALNIGRAFHWMGHMKVHGLGVAKDELQAAVYYKKGADRGYFVAKRSLLYLSLKDAGLMKKLVTQVRVACLMAKAGVIAYRNMKDERIADIPNAFQKQELIHLKNRQQ